MEHDVMEKKYLNGLMVLALLLVVTFVYQYLVLFSNVSNKRDFNPINTQNINTEHYRDSLVFKMIDYDLNHGVTDEINAEKAKRNVAFYYDKAREQCHHLTNSKYFLCVNDMLGNYFYYTESQEVSNNYAKQQSDCDLNAYMIYDIASMAKIDVSVVYAPFHAFIAWRNENGLYDYLETTKKNNHGSIADLSDRFYQKTFDKTYYTPMKSDNVYSVYKSLVYDLIPRDLNVSIDGDIKRNAIISDTYLLSQQEDNKLSLSDIKYTQALLKTDITSDVKKMVVAKWHFEHDDSKSANHYLKLIKDRDCFVDCIELTMEIQPQWKLLYSLYPAYNKFAFQLDAHVSKVDYFMAILSLILSIVTITMASMLVCQRLRLKEKR